MNELDHITDHLLRALEGPAWHGLALLELLNDVSAEQARAHPVVHAHSIWELVLHCITWHRTVTRRLRGEVAEIEPAVDWPHVPVQSDEAWQEAREHLVQSAKELLLEIQSFSLDRLEEPAPGQDYSFSVMLHGLVGHDLYHAGQIAILKKAL